MANIRETQISRDSLYRELEISLETIYAQYLEGDKVLRFTVAILCAAKLEAFINICGKRNLNCWDELEQSLSFKAKCQILAEIKGLEFDQAIEPNQTALAVFRIRNQIVHPKMAIESIDREITQEEYEARRGMRETGVMHPLKAELTPKYIEQITIRADEFIAHWGCKFMDDAEYWLSSGGTGRFSLQEKDSD